MRKENAFLFSLLPRARSPSYIPFSRCLSNVCHVCQRLSGLGPRYFFNHYPRYWIPPSVSITQSVATTLSYPQFHSNSALWDVFIVSLKWPMMQQIRVPRWPVVVNNSVNRHRSTAFISIELEIPAITLRTSTFDPHVSLEWDSERWIRLQFVKCTVLE